jgi:hypothetical protein
MTGATSIVATRRQVRVIALRRLLSKRLEAFNFKQGLGQIDTLEATSELPRDHGSAGHARGGGESLDPPA